MPDIVTDGDGDKYIGYEYIGETYSGNHKYLIEESDAIFAKEISKFTGDGIFLERIIERNKLYEIPLKDGFLPRFMGRGFSDQVDVPKDLHDKVISELLQAFKENYDEDFADVSLKGTEQDMVITTYYK